MTEEIRRSGRRPIGFWISIISMCLLVLATAVVLTAWSVRRIFILGSDTDPVLTAREKAMVMQIAEFPASARTAIQLLLDRQIPTALLRKPGASEVAWMRRFPYPGDNGYLLFSGIYKGEPASSVKLIRIADGKVLHSWEPDWKSILSKITKKRFETPIDMTNIRAMNPVLLDDGDLFFSTSTAAVRLHSCGRQSRWVLDELVHHSNDLHLDGTSVWSPMVALDAFSENPVLHQRSRIDAIGRISLEGKVLERHSFAKISDDNGLNPLLFNGQGTYDFYPDPVHINQIRVARTDSAFWKKGDLLVSVRNPNTVLLYRPSEHRVIWKQTGPWLHQHSADFVNDHQISVFNNNVVLDTSPDRAFLSPTSINEVMVYDFQTQEISQPFKSLLEVDRPRTVTQGRARILQDGGLFLEDTEGGRLLRYSKDKLLWSFVNDHGDGRIGALAWSSYLTPEEARKPLEALSAPHCPNTP